MNKKISSTLRNLMVATLVGGSLLVSVSSAHATLYLDYALDSSNPQGSISYNPTLSPDLFGSNLAVTTITGNNTTQNAGTANALSISGGALSFTTGAYTGQTGNTLSFAGGGTLSMTGAIGQLSIGSGSPLLTGTFTSVTVTEIPLTSQLKIDIVGAAFNSVDHQLIYSYFGIPADSTSIDALNLSFIANGTVNGGFISDSIGSGDLLDFPTPIPAAAWLLGSGLMGLVGIRRKGKNQ